MTTASRPASARARAGAVTSGRRLVVFGPTGQLGRELIESLEATRWPIDELVGVGSPERYGAAFEFRGEEQDVLAEAPALKGRDLVVICTPRGPALEIVRDALRAEVACIDCSGALAAQAAVPLWHPEAPGLESAPLVALPSATALAWRPVLEGLRSAAGITRISATVLTSASAWGAAGVAALSDESIALFNQTEVPAFGPAGRGVAFDVVPGGPLDVARVAGEIAREHGEGIALSLSAVQVPAFAGEGTVLSVELERPVAAVELERALSTRDELVLGESASLRDAVGAAQIRLGPIEAEPSGPTGRTYRIWLASDPLRLAAQAALAAAARRLGLE